VLSIVCQFGWTVTGDRPGEGSEVNILLNILQLKLLNVLQ